MGHPVRLQLTREGLLVLLQIIKQPDAPWLIPFIEQKHTIVFFSPQEHNYSEYYSHCNHQNQPVTLRV